MVQFQHSALLQSLGWAIANNIWQCGVLWLLYHIIVSIYNNASAKLKTNLSTLCLFAGFVWFIVTFAGKLTSLQNNLTTDAEKITASSQFIFISHDINLQDFLSALINSLPYLSLAYLIFLLILIVKLFKSYSSINFIRYNGLETPSAEWKVFTERIARHMYITKNIKLWFSKYVDVPATIGFFKPVILIPIASLNQLTTCQLEAIILHELSHIKRNDYLLNLIIAFIETILFFNPFVVLMSKIIKKERENCCDDFVLQYQYDRYSYASALLSLEKLRSSNFRLALTATSGKNLLLSRIKRIMEINSSAGRYNYAQRLLALIFTTTLIYLVATFFSAKKSNESFSRLPAESTMTTKAPVNKTKDVSKYITKEKKSFLLQSQIFKSSAFVRITTKTETEKKQQNVDAFSFKDRKRKNAVPAGAANEQSILLPGGVKSFPSLPAGGNSFFSSKIDLKDLAILEKFPQDIDKLKSDIESANYSTASDWLNLEQELNRRLEKLKQIPTIDLTLDGDKIRSVIEHALTVQKRNLERAQKHRQRINGSADFNIQLTFNDLLKETNLTLSANTGEDDADEKIVNDDSNVHD